ncbi:MAG: cation diffusion facilitator family transporter [Candidatus Gastranaerophilales bacterium]|nr:cation diffusion facilitator family transporter [Candidatus Gastranaerophilales bacterium]
MHECHENHCHCHHYRHIRNEKKTLIVIFITLITMIVEISFGYITNSMALLADGWHMAAHVIVLGMSYVAYQFIKKISHKQNAKPVSEKISALAGFTSSIFLLISAIWLIVESVERFFTPLDISFNEAILVVSISLVVNFICVLIMEYKNKRNKDYNFKAVYLHILSDVLTSLFAIIALFIGKYFGLYVLDPIMGIVAALVILKLSLTLIKTTSKVLLDIEQLKN